MLVQVSKHLLSVFEYIGCEAETNIYHVKGLHHLMWIYKTHILYDEINFSAVTELHATDISILSSIQTSLYSSMEFQFSLSYCKCVAVNTVIKLQYFSSCLAL